MKPQITSFGCNHVQCDADHVNVRVTIVTLNLPSIEGKFTNVFKGANNIALCRDSILNILTVAVLPVVPFLYAM